MKKLLTVLIVLNSICFAEVPISNEYDQTQDKTTIFGYAAKIPGYLGQMHDAMNAAEQVRGLRGLAQISGSGKAICELCNAEQLKNMQGYIQNINSDLCSQFSAAMSNITGTKQAIKSLQEVMSMFATNPKAAALALQQAIVATQSATQNTMAQMQMLQAQAQQKALAEEKYSKASQSSMQNSIVNARW